MQFCWCFLPHVTKTEPSKKILVNYVGHESFRILRRSHYKELRVWEKIHLKTDLAACNGRGILKILSDILQN